ncbi:MAG: DUF4129 domain-containing protein [Halovenus sp.]
MVRRSLTLIAVATIAVVAIGLSAATLLSTVPPASSGGGLSGNDSGSGLFEEVEPEEPPEDSGEMDIPRSLEILLSVLLVLLFAGSLVYLLFYKPQLLLTIVLIALGGLVLWVLIQHFVWDGLDLFGGSSGLFGGESGGVGSEEEADGTVPALPAVLAVLVGIGLLVALAAYFGHSGRPSEAEEPGDGTVEENNPRDIGRIAGDAADRIESDDGGTADADNEVYRAWREMTEQLDVEGAETTTPGEFKTAAVDAGMSPDDVRELTRLFEDVRYGGHDPTADREQRALDVLRRIEEKYGEKA